MKYSDYNTEDFLQDEYFVNWVKSPNKDSDFFWSSWMDNNPDKVNQLMKAKEIVLLLNFKPIQSNLKATQEEEDSLFKNILKGKPSHTGKRIKQAEKRHIMNKIWLKVASILLPTIGLIWILNKPVNETQSVTESIVWITKDNPNGKKTAFNLPDGSRVHLNSASKLRYPSQFDSTKREVFLEGEAFFDIVKNKQKPFFVNTPHLKTKVVGTSFNIRAFPNETSEKVALVTGKIGVYNKAKKDTTGIYLKPKQALKFRGNKLKRVPFNRKVLDWKEGVIRFEKCKFPEVVSRLERWYGVTFHIENNRTIKGNFTGTFKKQSLKVVLEVLSETSDFQFKIKNKEVFIH